MNVRNPMTIEIAGVTYYSASDIHKRIGITRQTLWRWRKESKIPQGLRYRDHQIVFTENEVELIFEYANRLEPVEPSGADKNKILKANQLKRRK